MFPVKNGLEQNVVSLLLFNFALEYAIMRAQVSQDGLKLNGTHQPLVYADDVNILGRSIHTIKKHTKDSVVASMEIGLQVNADKTKYLVKSQDQNAGQSHTVKFGNISFDRVEKFTYLGTTLTNKNYIKK
jgi:hypothetical protein